MARPDVVDGLVAFWDFSEAAGENRVSRVGPAHPLREMAGPIDRVAGGPFGWAARFREGQWMNLPAVECPALDFGGPRGEVTMIAWLLREAKSVKQCQAVAGRWNETDRGRQYALFLDLTIWDSGDQVGGHFSNIGGPTPGHRWCMDAAIGQTKVPLGEWVCAAVSYGRGTARAYLNGTLDQRGDRNPYAYPGGLYAGEKVSDFTVGGVDRSGEIGNWFTGLIGGLAIYGRMLSDEEVAAVAASDGRGGGSSAV